MANEYSYKVQGSDEDNEYVATVREFPSLSWLAGSPAEAERGIRSLVDEVVADMEKGNEELPQPLG